MSDPYTAVPGSAVPTRRRQLRVWITRGLALAAGAIAGPRRPSGLTQVLRNPHLARDIGRETDARELSQMRLARLRQRTLW